LAVRLLPQGVAVHRGGVVGDQPAKAMWVSHRELQRDHAAVRVAENERFRFADVIEHGLEVACVGRHEVLPAGKQAAPAGADRVEINHGEVILE
jgi:hypothetical protein